MTVVGREKLGSAEMEKATGRATLSDGGSGHSSKESVIN